MPAKSKNTRAAQQVGRSAKRRVRQQNTLRQRGDGKPSDVAIVADSIFAVTWAPKSGSEVYFTRRGDEGHVEHGSVEKVYSDIYSAFANFRKQHTGEDSVDTYKLGVDIHIAFAQILRLMEQMLPSGYHFNVDYDEGAKCVQQYYLVIYHECPFPEYWHSLEIGPVVKKLRKNKPLHNLFLSFLHSFSTSCGIYLWDEGRMEQSLEYLKDCQIHDVEDEYGADSSEYQEQQKCIAKYEKGGEAAKYAALIKQAPILTHGQLSAKARKFTRDAEIANLIHQGAEIMSHGYNILTYDYKHETTEDGYYDFEIAIDDCCTIIWDWNDELTEVHRQFIDNDAQNGNVQYPVRFQIAKGETKNIDLKEMAEAVSWPKMLSQFFDRSDDLINKYLGR